MTELVPASPVTPVILHEGRYRLYEKADGTLHLVYRPDGKEQDEHLEVPGALIKLAKDAAEGNINPMDMMKMAGKMMGGGGLFGGNLRPPGLAPS
jgi:hypothetical protein